MEMHKSQMISRASPSLTAENKSTKRQHLYEKCQPLVTLLQKNTQENEDKFGL